jgi:hypothetical protein
MAKGQWLREAVLRPELAMRSETITVIGPGADLRVTPALVGDAGQAPQQQQEARSSKSEMVSAQIAASTVRFQPSAAARLASTPDGDSRLFEPPRGRRSCPAPVGVGHFVIRATHERGVGVPSSRSLATTSREAHQLYVTEPLSGLNRPGHIWLFRLTPSADLPEVHML